ncbi:hypothetical protein FRC09_016997 [Ceratobasidium sp. 395]|nr:hypothetical protein FRC09_016997 [Ceratobasidium sp. 395]
MKELIAGGHTVGRRAATREIFLGARALLPSPFEPGSHNSRKGKGKGKRMADLSEEDEESDSNPVAEENEINSIEQEEAGFSNPEPAWSSLLVAPSPTPTVVDLGDSNAEVEATSGYLARSLSILDIPSLATGWPEALIPGRLAAEIGSEGDVDPFTDDYTI